MYLHQIKIYQKSREEREKKGYKERTHEEEHGYCLRFCRNRAHSIRSLIFHSSFLDTHYLLKKKKKKETENGRRKEVSEFVGRRWVLCFFTLVPRNEFVHLFPSFQQEEDSKKYHGSSTSISLDHRSHRANTMLELLWLVVEDTENIEERTRG